MADSGPRPAVARGLRRRLVRSALAASLVAAAAVGGCLDARSGAVGAPGAHADDEGAGAALDCRAGAPPAFAMVSARVGAWDLGPCGHLAYVDEKTVDRSVVLLGPRGDELATYSPGYGWFGRVAFGPRRADALMAFETFRSDLGFGDWTVVDPAAPGTPLAIVDFSASDGRSGFSAAAGAAFFWHCAAVDYHGTPGPLGYVARAGSQLLTDSALCETVVVRDAVVVAAVGEDEQRLTWWDVASGESGDLGVVQAAWGYGDIVRWRDELAVSADGALIAVQRVNETYLGPQPKPAPTFADLTVYARGGDGVAMGVAAGSVRDVILPVRGSAMVFTAPGEGVVSWIRPDGAGFATGSAAAEVALFVFADGAEALVRSGAGVLATLSLTDGVVRELAAGSAGPFAVTPDEGAVVFGASDGELWRLVRWDRASGAVTTLAGALPALPSARWAGASGAALVELPREVSGGGSTGGGADVRSFSTLLAADGRALWQVEGRFESATAVGDDLFVATHHANDDLVVLDPATGRARDVMTGHDFELRADAAGARIALRFGPLSAVDDNLWFGRAPTP